jgi:hypothetical protein
VFADFVGTGSEAVVPFIRSGFVIKRGLYVCYYFCLLSMSNCIFILY